MLLRLAALVLCCTLSSGLWGQETTDPDVQELQQAFQRKEFKPQARVAALQGIEFLESKEYKKAINAFSSATKMHPNNGQFRHMLGVAFFRDQQLGRAWLQLRKAVALNPTYAPGVRDFESLWVAFERRGVFSMGRPTEQIAKFIGEPDDKVEDDRQQIWKYGFMRLQFVNDRLTSIIDPRGVEEADRYPVDALRVVFDDPSRWILANRFINRVHSLTEYVPEGQTTRDWKEILQLQRLLHQAIDSSPSKLVANIQKKLQANDPQVNFSVILENPDEVLYQWNTPGSQEQAPQHEIVRLVKGQRDIHRLAYTRRARQIPQADAQKWLELLRKAPLESKSVQSSAAPSE